MAGKTAPWWQKVIVGAFRGLRAGFAALLKPAKKAEETTSRVQHQGDQVQELSQNSPQTTPIPAPEIEPAAKQPAETGEQAPPKEESLPPGTNPPDEPSNRAIEDSPRGEPREFRESRELLDQAEPAAPTPEVRENPEEESSASEPAPEDAVPAGMLAETVESPADLLAAVAFGTSPAADPETPETEKAEAAPAADAEPLHEAAGDQPAQPGQAIEETIVTPEVETEATAREPDLEAASEVFAEEEAGEFSVGDEEPPAQEPAQNYEASQELPAEPAEPQSSPDEIPSPAEIPAPPAAADSAPDASAEPEQPAPPPPAAAPAPPQLAQQPVKREQGPDTSPVSVVVSHVYEGPFDLLLDLIRKQDIDIYDIPIARITAQFLAYVNQLRATDMDVAGEFIYTASLLIHIKSKMLLPREPSGADDVAEDPRRELVERLLEHERFKNAAQMLQQKQMLEAATWTNSAMREFREDAGAEPEIAADTTDLVRIFREILERARNRPVINVEEDAVTVGQMIQFLGRRLTMEDKPVALRRLLAHTKSERALIAMFLALLELVRLQAILLRQDRHFSEIFIKKSAGFDSVMNQGLARDDWQ